jgi:hypothetical protein
VNVARHEAGHALVATVLGWEVAWVEIWLESDGKWDGLVEWFHTTATSPKDFVMVRIAGQLAIDFELSPEQLWGVLGKRDLLPSYSNFCNTTMTAAHRRVAFPRLVRETSEILRKYRLALDAMTKRLSRRLWLRSDAICEIIERFPSRLGVATADFGADNSLSSTTGFDALRAGRNWPPSR